MRPCRTPSTGEELNYSEVSEVCLYLVQRQHLLPTAAPPGFSSGLLLRPLLLSLQVSVRPEGQQRRSHLDAIKLEMPKKKKSHIQSVSRTDMWDSIFFHSFLISSHPSLRVLSFLNCPNSNSSLFFSFLLIFPSSTPIFLGGGVSHVQQTVIVCSSALI